MGFCFHLNIVSESLVWSTGPGGALKLPDKTHVSVPDLLLMEVTEETIKMKEINKVMLMGRLGGDPIARHTKAGNQVVNFSLATHKLIYRNENSSSEIIENVENLGLEKSKRETTTQWHQVVVWGKMGDTCVKYLRKGSKIFLEGSIRTRRYQTAEGESRTVSEIHAEDITFLTLTSGDIPANAH
jgi:single-strand DNA-binding protein